MLEWSDAKNYVPTTKGFRTRHPNSWWHLYQGRVGTCAPSSVAMLIYNMGFSLSSYMPWGARSVLGSEVLRASKWAIWNKDTSGAKMRTTKDWGGKYPGMNRYAVQFLLEAYGLNVISNVSTTGEEKDTQENLKKAINEMPVNHACILAHDDHAMCVIKRGYGAMVFDPAQKVGDGGATWIKSGAEIVSINKSGDLCITKNHYNSEYPVETFLLVGNDSMFKTLARSAWSSLWTEHQYLTWWFHKKK